VAARRPLALALALVAATLAAAAAAQPLMVGATGFWVISVDAPREARTNETIQVCVNLEPSQGVYVEKAEVSVYGIEPSVRGETLLYRTTLDSKFRRCFVGVTSTYSGLVRVYLSIEYVDSRGQSHRVSVSAPVTVVAPIPLSQFEYVKEQYEKCKKDERYWYDKYQECAKQRHECAVQLAKLTGELAWWRETARELNSSYAELAARYVELVSSCGALEAELGRCRVAAAVLFAMLALAALALPALWAKARKK
jgi:hypothetical protein